MVAMVVVEVVFEVVVEVEEGRCGGGRPISHYIVLPPSFFFGSRADIM